MRSPTSPETVTERLKEVRPGGPAAEKIMQILRETEDLLSESFEQAEALRAQIRSPEDTPAPVAQEDDRPDSPSLHNAACQLCTLSRQILESLRSSLELV